MDNKKSEAAMYSALRRRIKDEFSGRAEINKLRTCNGLRGLSQNLSFVAYVEVFGYIVVVHGRTENEIVESLKDNIEKEYGSPNGRLDYTPFMEMAVMN
jgi:hypothetical protein